MPSYKFAPWMAGCALALLAGCASLPNTTQLRYEEARGSLAQRGTSSPVVVFQAGLGNGMSVWSAVLTHLPPEVSTFAYDRPGYGESSSKSAQRSPCDIARELHDVLHLAGVRPPYVLVGHSLGGLYQYAYAKLYPEEVSALLLVDATHPEHWHTMQRQAPQSAAMVQGLRTIAFSETERREFDAQSECIADLKMKHTPPVPARLLLRTRSESIETPAFQDMSRQLAARWPELLPGMTIARVEDAGHFIQTDQPARVAAEITALVAPSRAKQP